MATGADVRDILELGGGDNDGPISKKDLINSDKVRDNCEIPIMWHLPVFTNCFTDLKLILLLSYISNIYITITFF